GQEGGGGGAGGMVGEGGGRAVRERVRADEPAQRHERHALLCRLKGGVQRRAGRVLHLDRARGDGGGEARRRAELGEADGGGLDRVDAAGADEEIGLQA